MIIANVEGFYFLLGKECFKEKNFEQGKLYLSAHGGFPLSGTTHFEILGTNCHNEDFNGTTKIKDVDIPLLQKILQGRDQIHLSDDLIPKIGIDRFSGDIKYLDLSCLN